MRIFFLWVIFALPLSAQISQDTETQKLVASGLRHLYNMDFKSSEPFFQKIRQAYPNHPVNPMLSALAIYWQNLPITDNPTAEKKYVAFLNATITQAEKLKKDPKTSEEATFFLLAAHSYLTMLESDKRAYFGVLSEGRRTYGYMKDGFKLAENNPEFLFSTGLYNYYREQYPNDHPIVKPMMVVFQNGNKTLGMKQLETASQKGTFTKTEAAFYLVYLLLKHENQPYKALKYSALLVEQYPNNPVYQTRHTEALVLSSNFAEAEPLAQQLARHKTEIFSVAGNVFLGIVLEKGKKNDPAAVNFYRKALATKPNERFTKDYQAMAFCGLARVALRSGKTDEAREFYKKALDLAEYISTINEAKNYLKK